MAGPRSPLCYLDKAVRFLVPRSKASFPVPVPRSLFTDLSHYKRSQMSRKTNTNVCKLYNIMGGGGIAGSTKVLALLLRIGLLQVRILVTAKG